MATLRSRILVPTAVLGTVVGLTVLVLGWQAAQQATALQAEVDRIRSANALAFVLTEAADAEQRWVLSFHFRPGDVLRGRIGTQAERIGELVEQLGAIGLRPRAASLWREYAATRVLLLQARDELMRASPAGAHTVASLAFDKWNLATDRANALLASFATYHVRRLERAVVDLERQRATALYVAGTALVVGVALAVAFSMLLSRSLVRPIVAMASTAERIADQRLAVPVEGSDRQDEIGTLARAFNRMTERLVSANAQLAEAVRARDEFISIASHELKTPLTPLKLQLQTLQRHASRAAEGELPPARVLHAIRNFNRLVTRVAQLVENMLDVSRITSGRLTLKLEDVPIPGLLQDVAEGIEHLLLESGCTLRVEPGYAGTVRGDRLRLDQVLENLVGNATRYAPSSEILLRSLSRDGSVFIEVEDHGGGIAPEDHQRIFARFERAVGDRHGGGLGLGLYIAREIVRAHGGELSVSSELGRGSVFRVRLPVAADPEV